ncbi:MAG: type II secretion system protein, partial [Armatimonadota bacterium]
MSRRRSTGGFTLLEVVVSVAILGLISTTVMSGLLFTMS